MCRIQVMKWKVALFNMGIGLWLTAVASGGENPWNSPYTESDQKTYYSSISTIPKTFDPARSYSNDEVLITAQVYEPPYQYHYFKHPYTLVPLTATRMPIVTQYRRHGVVYKTTYDIEIQPGIYYQPHAAFAAYPGHTRELTAGDYVYEIKRLASPIVASPIFGWMSRYIMGFQDFSDRVTFYKTQHPEVRFVDLRLFPLVGATVQGRYAYRISIDGEYSQFIYWLSMNFFAPIPWEVDRFYAEQAACKKKQTFDWNPVGTGPYYFVENNPNKRIVLARNPYFHDKKLPYMTRIIYSLDKEVIPRWNKFLQGYYDRSGVPAQYIQNLPKQNLGIRKEPVTQPIIFYIGFNMLDPVVGGYTVQKKKLRQAIGIAIDNESYIRIFFNDRGIPAQGPIPPGIFGYMTGQKGMNRFVYDWKDHHRVRKPLSVARQLLAEAGYPGGRDPVTKKPLILNYDAISIGSSNDKALFDWYRQQFAKLGISLNIRSTLYNQFQEHVRTGKTQIFFWSWLVDYPDPENCLFLFYSKNAIAKTGGENVLNYANPVVDTLFDAISQAPNTIARQEKINRLLDILREDSPAIWQMHPQELELSHQWVVPLNTRPMIYNMMKYRDVDPVLRGDLIVKWNKPQMWPFFVICGGMIAVALLSIIAYKRRGKKSCIRRVPKS